MQENERELSLIKQRILLYLETKHISLYRFYLDSGMTRGVLTKPDGLAEKNLFIFLQYAADISLEWLFRGEGEILDKNKVETPPSPETDSEAKVLYPSGTIRRKAGDISGDYKTEDDPA